jgi:glutamate synthase (NADPH/NADH)
MWLMEIFLRREQQNVELPPLGRYATGILYLDRIHHQESEAAFAKLAEECELQVSV